MPNTDPYCLFCLSAPKPWPWSVESCNWHKMRIHSSSAYCYSQSAHTWPPKLHPLGWYLGPWEQEQNNSLFSAFSFFFETDLTTLYCHGGSGNSKGIDFWWGQQEACQAKKYTARRQHHWQSITAVVQWQKSEMVTWRMTAADVFLTCSTSNIAIGPTGPSLLQGICEVVVRGLILRVSREGILEVRTGSNCSKLFIQLTTIWGPNLQSQSCMTEIASDWQFQIILIKIIGDWTGTKPFIDQASYLHYIDASCVTFAICSVSRYIWEISINPPQLDHIHCIALHL